MNSDNSVPLGIVCTPAQYERSLNDTSIYCLSRNETIGLMAPTVGSLVSLFALSFVFIIVLRNTAQRIRHASKKELPVSTGGPMDFLLFSLFSGGTLQVLGAIMMEGWKSEDFAVLKVSFSCHLIDCPQINSIITGIMQQLGETAAALTILVIAVYAFLGGWLRKDIKTWPIWITQGLLIAIWLFVAVMVLLGNIINRGKGHTHFVVPTPYWCWISPDYFRWRLWGQYIWFWLAFGVSFFTCIPLYLWSRGHLEFGKFRLQKAELSADPQLKAIKHQSLVMIAHPVVYCIFISPLIIVRWISFIRHSFHISSTTSFSVAGVFSLGPAANVALLLAMRADSVLFGRPKNFTSGYPPLRDSQKYSLHNLERSKDDENIGAVALLSSA